MTRSGNSTVKQNQPSPSDAQTTGVHSRVWSTSLTMVVLLGIFASGLLTSCGLFKNNSPVAEAAAPATPVRPSPTLPNPPPTEPPQEVAWQQELRDWLETVVGVTNVLSIDVDLPTDEPPLVYVEIEVSPGYNDARMGDILVTKLNETLDTTQYSDFVLIIDDGSQIVEYDYDSENIVWTETVLSSKSPPSP